MSNAAIDPDLLEAMREVDALTPSVPPMAPPRPAPERRQDDAGPMFKLLPSLDLYIGPDGHTYPPALLDHVLPTGWRQLQAGDPARERLVVAMISVPSAPGRGY